jgi:hypothetical protein
MKDTCGRYMIVMGTGTLLINALAFRQKVTPLQQGSCSELHSRTLKIQAYEVNRLTILRAAYVPNRPLACHQLRKLSQTSPGDAVTRTD